MKRILTLFSALLITLSLCGSISEAKNQTKSETKSIEQLEVHFIDVGQGDATLIKCGDKAMLIDAGGNDKGTLVQNYIRKQGIKALDYLLITNEDSDHCGGADIIIAKYDIDTIIYPNYEKKTKNWRDVVKAMDNRDYEVTKPVVGDTYKLGDAEFTIIAPNREDYEEESNNYSVGILLEHGDKKFIFTGDAEKEAEKDILKNKIDISADVLQVGYHGSKKASTKEFVKAVNPDYAVISCGKDNEFEHPHKATLETLESNKVKVFRTDEQGTVVAISNGKEIIWDTEPIGQEKAAAKAPEKEETKEAAVPAAEEVKEAVPSVEKEAPSVEAPKEDAAPAVEEPAPSVLQDTQGLTYVLNTKTKKFHKPGCSSLPTTNRSDSTQSRDEIIAQGYVPCKRCNP